MEFYQRLPKVELHAHINGSIGPSLLRKLVEEYEKKRPGEMGPDYESILKKLQTDETEDITLAECFVAFKCIHRVSGDEKSVRVVIVVAVVPVFWSFCHELTLRCRFIPGSANRE